MSSSVTSRPTSLRRPGWTKDHRTRHRRGQGARREVAHAHRLRRDDRQGLRRGRHPGAARRRLGRPWSSTATTSTCPSRWTTCMPLTAAVVRGTSRAMVVADLPFGSYQSSPQQALETAARFMKEAGAHAVKLEGGRRVLPQVEAAGRGRHPGHGAPRPDPAVGQRPRRLPGRRAAASQATSSCPTPRPCEYAGAFSVVLELRPRPSWPSGSPRRCRSPRRHRRRARHRRPGAGLAGPHGPDRRAPPKFVKQYSDLAAGDGQGRPDFADEVATGAFPTAEHSYH